MSSGMKSAATKYSGAVLESKQNEEAIMAGISETTKITSKGQITIPLQIRNAVNIRRGQSFVFRVRKDGILMKPVNVSVQDMTTTKAWAAGLKASKADLKAGRSTVFMSGEDFLKDLARLSAESKTERRKAPKTIKKRA